MNNKKKIGIIASICLVVLLVVGASYAYWTTTQTQEDENIIGTTCLSLEFRDTVVGKTGVKLQKTYPISDEEGKSLEGYQFTLINRCDGYVSYTVNLESLINNNRIALSSINAILDDASVKTLSNYSTSTQVLENTIADDARFLENGILGPNGTRTYTLKIWLDKYAPDTEMNKSYSGKITIRGEMQKEPTLASDYITALKTNGDTSLLYDETTDNNLRYVGANPKNYVLYNNELWRIIGVMNNVDGGTVSGDDATRVKIIRADLLGDIRWNTQCDLQQDGTCSAGNSSNNWNEATLKTLLNTAYLNRTVSTEYNYGKLRGQANDDWNKFDFTNIGIRSYDRSLAEAATYYLGEAPSDFSYESLTSSDYYGVERGSYVYNAKPTSWTGVVALMYPSDYGYATSGGDRTSVV